MMKNGLIFLFLFAAACSTYSSGDLDGKWKCYIDGKPYELWIHDTLALGFDFENQFMVLYKIDYERKLITFTNIEPYKEATWQDKILKLEQDEFLLELQNPGNLRVTRYSRKTNEIPEISTDYEANAQPYEKYLNDLSN